MTKNSAKIDAPLQIILIIDDDPNSTSILVDFLTSCNFYTITADNGASGLKKAALLQPDLILLDVMMQEMNGFETCRQLKAIEVTQDIPVIFMTALADTEDLMVGFSVGGVDYITKPFQLSELLARIKTHLRLRAAQKQQKLLTAQLQQELLEYQQASTTQQSKKEQDRTLFETMVQGVVYQTDDGRVIAANRAAERIVGLSLAQMQGNAPIDPRWHIIREDGTPVNAANPAQLVPQIERDIHNVVIGIFKPATAAYTWANINVIIHPKSSASRPYQVYTTFEDITERKQAEEALRESEERFRSFIEQSAEGITLTDETGRIIEFNRTMEFITGFSRESVLGQTSWGFQMQLIAPHLRNNQLRERMKRITLNALSTGKTPSFNTPVETTVYCADGNSRFIRQIIFPIKTKNGYRLGSVVHDITDYKQTQEALQQSETQLQILVETSPVAIVILDRAGQVLSTNKKFIEIFGYTPKDVPSIDHWWEVAYPDPDYREWSKAMWLTRLTEAIQTNGELTPVESKVFCKDGRTRYATFSEAIVGNRHIVAAIDITERKQTEDALRESQQMLSNVIDQFPGFVFWKDRQSVYMGCNHAFAAEGNLEPPDIIGKTDFDMLWTQDKAEIYRAEDAWVIENGRATLNVVGSRPLADGQLSWTSTNKTPLFDADGQIVGILGVSHDITKIKQTEEELRLHRDHLEELVKERTAELMVAKEKAETASRSKSAFLANMSHELRTPLNAVLGYAQILQQQPLDPEVISRLNIIQQSGQHLLTLINDILDLSKIEAYRLELHPTAIHLPTFLENIVGLIRPRVEAKNLKFNFEAPALPGGIEADETRLRQVLLNLLGNAVKFTHAGQISLRVRANLASAPQPTVLLTFEVADTGVGIDADQLEWIFQPFEQAGAVNLRVEGTGLGLTISRQLVQLMGSELHVQSEPGQGSVFWFEARLPLVTTPQPQRIIQGYRGPQPKVLAAGDHTSSRAAIVDMLAPMGFALVEAVDGRQAIELAQTTRPDLILLDQNLPGLNNFEAVQGVRQTYNLLHPPIIAIAATPADVPLNPVEGIDAFLSRPFTWPQLAALLEQFLKLDWVYAETNTSAAPSGPTAELKLPPPEILAHLHELVLIGNMRQIRDYATQIEAMGKQYRPFAATIRQLAKEFAEEKILALLEQPFTKTGEK